MPPIHDHDNDPEMIRRVRQEAGLEPKPPKPPPPPPPPPESAARNTSNWDRVPRTKPDGPRPMHVRVVSDYAFPGLNGFLDEAAKRAGFGYTNTEGSLLQKGKSDWFFVQAGQMLANTGQRKDPAEVKAGIDRVVMLQTVLSLIVIAIGDAIKHRDNPDSDPTPTETPTPPELTDGTRHLRPGKPEFQRGNLRKFTS